MKLEYLYRRIVLTNTTQFFLSKFRNGIIFCGCSSEIKQFFRVIFNISLGYSYRSKFKGNRILIILTFYIYECVIFVFKYKSKLRTNNNFKPNANLMNCPQNLFAMSLFGKKVKSGSHMYFQRIYV